MWKLERLRVVGEKDRRKGGFGLICLFYFSCTLWYNYGIIIPFYEEVYSMPQIIPIKDLKNTSEISELCHKSKEPIYITKNGYGDMVIMSMEIYESVMKQLNVYRELELSEQQISEGKVSDARESLSNMRKRYGV